MTRSQFFKHFDVLADQPDAVAKMRQLVLDLAVRGKLVSNGSKAEKDAAWTTFLALKALSAAELSPAFDVPSHWCWARLDDVAAPCGQKKPDTRFTYVDVGAIDNERGVINEDVEVLAPEDAPSRARKLVVQNAVIYSTVRPYLKNIAIIDRKFSPPAIVSTAFAVLNPKKILDSRYLYHWLRSRAFQADVESKMKGVAYPAISDSEFWDCLIPIPPPSEQRRIVDKVDELMALCDELEQWHQARQHARVRLTESAYRHLTAAKNPADFRRHFNFAICHSAFDLDDLPQLRQAILQLAVQGRLGSEYTQGGGGKQKLGEVIDLISGQHLVPSEYNKERKGIPYLTGPADFGPRYPTASRWTDCPKVVAKKGDILLTVKGAGVGKTNVVQDEQVAISRQLMAVRSKTVDHGFIELSLKSAFDAFQAASNGIAIPGISRDDVLNYKIWIPPLVEQKRIVTLVEALLRQCDALEAQLRQTRTLGAHLLDSTLHHLLAA